MNAPNGYYPALNGLRAVAVLLVFSEHYAPVGSRISEFGWTGVDIFFVLSGFLITGILFDSRNRKHHVRDFYARRILRIFPLFYAIWLALFALGIYTRWDWRPAHLFYLVDLGNYIKPFSSLGREHADLLTATRPGVRYVLRQTEIAPMWSLCVEEQFYLVWPMLVFSNLRRETLMRICASSIVVVLLLRIVLQFTLPEKVLNLDVLYVSTVTRCDSLLLGGLIALALRGPEKIWVAKHHRALCTLGYGCFACLAAYCMLHTGLKTGVSHEPLVATVGFSLAAIGAGAMILDSIEPGTVVNRVLQLGVLQHLGKVSYGFYLIHFMPFLLFSALAIALVPKHLVLGRAVIALICTLIAASLSFCFLETPFLRLKNRFSHQTHQAPVPHL
jgi:peptidoglycan/LPS O-acetylase OafA/YrhL